VVEQAFGNRRGALIAIEPSTGDILAYVSMPTFDPNLFVEGIDQQSWDELNNSPDKPLVNRPLSGSYPPGSTYKPFMALAALELGKRSPMSAISDPGYFMFGNHRFRDDKEGGHGLVDMYKSIVHSCDTYYYILANDMGVDLMHDTLSHYGFGEYTGIDIAGEARGLLPSTAWKRKAYKKPEQQRWYAGETISLGIGQGYNNFTVLQIANATATIANNGVRMKPHLVREIVDVSTKQAEPVAPVEADPLRVKPENLAVIRKALVGVNIEGTGASAFRGAAYTSGGKTGTAQVITIAQGAKYNASQLDERHRDHALYMAYAPADNPQIALALVVENAGFGGANSAPIARRVFDYWLQGLYPNDEDIALVQKGQAQAPVGKPRPASEVGWPPGTGNVPVAQAPAAAASSAASAPKQAAGPASAPVQATTSLPAASAVPVRAAAR
jgi:penicillin-binding protein 2